MPRLNTLEPLKQTYEKISLIDDYFSASCGVVRFLRSKEGNDNHNGGQHDGDIDHEEEGRHNRRSHFDGNEEDERYVVIDGQEACDEEGFRD